MADFCMMRSLGGLGEWFKPAVLKTAEGKPSVSSNLTASARLLCLRSFYVTCPRLCSIGGGFVLWGRVFLRWANKV